MIALLALVAMQQTPLRGIVRDGVTREPVVWADVWSRGTHARSGDDGRFLLGGPRGDSIHARRVGYRPGAVVVAGADSVIIYLEPVTSSLRAVVSAGAASAGTLGAARDVAALRASGAATLADALTRMPFISSRSSRAGVALSMRGSRPEQVLVLLDGVALNDPATGSADIADIPLAALGSVATLPGAAGARYGSGATGGVLALSSADAPAATLTAGSYGRAGASLAGRTTLGGARVHGGAEWSSARDDFEFVNSVAAPIASERRLNADEHRLALFGGISAASFGATLLATRDERGLVGPMNVRIYDAARGRTQRALARVTGEHSGWSGSLALRFFDLLYDNPGVLRGSTTSTSTDADLSREAGSIVWRAGGGVDWVRGSQLISADRPRAFVSAERGWTHDAWMFTFAGRGDAIRGAGARMSPSLAIERPDAITLFARVSQAFRAPTFYDLYFASPQFIDGTRTLRPERVLFDGELGARASANSITASASLFARRTRDAIVWFPGTFSWSPNNVERETVVGGEGRIALALPGGAIEAWGGARSTRLLVDNLDAPTPYVPWLDGGALATLRHGPAALTATLTALGSRPIVTVPHPTAAVELPAVALLDVAATLAPRAGHITATLAVHNVANTRWESIARYPVPGRSLSATLTFTP
ncbi:MAG: TonB-dependent receptor [Gemmatimonadota bacterium]|nr:TonB-dependent receptor [Gemmatimonadota bacterium]